FVQQGGTLITEGSTSTIFPEYNFTSGITVENSGALFARGSIMRGIISDKKSPIMYGYEGTQMPIYFNQDPILQVAGAGGGFGGFGGGGGGGGGPAGVGQNTTPMAGPPLLSPWDGANPVAVAPGAGRGPGRGAGGGGGGGGGGGAAGAAEGGG